MSQAANIEQIQARLVEALKELYPLAMNADEQLEVLQGEDKGKFSAIFQKDSEFTVEANRFLPYLIELNDEIQSLKIMEEQNQQNKIKQILIKIQEMHKVLTHFHSIKDSDS
ncbi:hypothetical protein EOPP23_16900 [Endozoicomonas sp. OPT23]|uniref:hypothetical protein n=1 Tax=Endozoicomonas sp. OPT23 TaxID=2072845 RepID=UPI00129B1593|nr:hypothetical protein [Endozoicomonas sp. OPT23]MRI34664.1 hypothetical protein [Endozoicomonas sp. OPT23]